MKKTICTLLVIVLCFSSFGCGLLKDEQNDYTGMIKTSFKNISFYVYEDWREGKESGNNKYYYPDNGMLMVQLQDFDLDTEDSSVWQSYMDGIKEGFENYVQKSLKKIEINGFKGFKATYTGRIEGRNTINDMVLLEYDEGKTVSFLIGTWGKEKQLYDKELMKIVSTVSIEKDDSSTIEETIEDDYDDDYLDDIEETTLPDVPDEYINALEKADSYANYQYMSKKSLYKQLTSDYGEGFSKKAAKYAIKHVKTNWKKNALHKATDYANDQYMSKQSVYEQLTSAYGEQFTAKQANYAIKHVKANWKKNALQKAKDYSEDMSMSRQEIYEQLCSQYGEKFTVQEAQYAINHLK